MAADGIDVRDATAADVQPICRFGAAVIPPHYAPLIGTEAALAQVRDWWSADRIATAVRDGLVVVAERAGQLVGVAQRGRAGADHVIYKLYLEPGVRGQGVGRRLIDALVAQLPLDAERICVEHFAANERAAAFYEREGFTVDRVEPGPSGDPRRAVVWRSRRLRPL
jgi:GNAT superfamily N-acetyltransferase